MVLQSRVHPADRVPGAWEDEPLTVRQAQMISSGWLRFLGIPLVAGRDFEQEPGGFDADVTIIGTNLARQLWGNADPLGRRIVTIDGERELTVIGVVDERAVRRASGTDAALFVPLAASFMQSFAVRTDAPIEPMLPTIRGVVTAATPDLSISGMTVLATEWAEERRTVLSLIGATATGGLLALLLSAIGLYALVSLTVAERKREIGIRGALGAGRLAIVRPYVSRAITLAVIGMVVGLPISLVGARALNAFAQQEVIHLPAVTTLVCISVLTVVALATLIPASRAVRMQPIDTLRGAD
jgi:hypothetical protein